MDKRQKEATKYFTIVALIIIPIVSLKLAFKGPIFDLTLSKVGARGEYSLLVLWGSLVSIFFFTSIMYLMQAYKLEDKKTKFMLFVGCILIMVTVSIPYVPQTLPTLSALHNYFAYIGIISLLISMYFFIIKLNKINKKIFRTTILYFNVIVVVSSVILFVWGTSSFFEVLLVIMASNLIYLINYMLNKDTVKKEAEKLLEERSKAIEVYSLKEAIDVRTSRRAFIDYEINSEQANYLNNIIKEVNEKSGLNVCLVMDGSKAFSSFRKTYGLFSGVKSLLILKGDKNIDSLKEKVGFYGEYLVLKATQIGLSSCWVASTFDKNNSSLLKEENEEIVAVIPIGLSFDVTTHKEDAIIKAMKRKRKDLDKFFDASGEVPDWFLFGVEAVQKAPSAKNSQKVRLTYKDEQIYISIKDDEEYDMIDLGIAKFHFETFVNGKFSEGNDALFYPKE